MQGQERIGTLADLHPDLTDIIKHMANKRTYTYLEDEDVRNMAIDFVEDVMDLLDDDPTDDYACAVFGMLLNGVVKLVFVDAADLLEPKWWREALIRLSMPQSELEARGPFARN